jgi:hypothetical protein
MTTMNTTPPAPQPNPAPQVPADDDNSAAGEEDPGAALEEVVSPAVNPPAPVDPAAPPAPAPDRGP